MCGHTTIVVAAGHGGHEKQFGDDSAQFGTDRRGSQSSGVDKAAAGLYLFFERRIKREATFNLVQEKIKLLPTKCRSLDS